VNLNSSLIQLNLKYYSKISTLRLNLEVIILQNYNVEFITEHSAVVLTILLDNVIQNLLMSCEKIIGLDHVFLGISCRNPLVLPLVDYLLEGVKSVAALDLTQIMISKIKLYFECFF